MRLSRYVEAVFAGVVLVARASYPTDLTDEQWKIIEPMIPAARSGPRKGGRPRSLEMREVINAMLYLLRSGCAWRLLPHEFGNWSSVYHYFRKWRRNGLLQKIHDALHEAVREQEGRQPTPSAAIVDSQSVKTGEKGGAGGAMTRERKSRGASGTRLSTRRG